MRLPAAVGWLGKLWVPVQMVNPSETFGDIVIDYSYVELSSACITALTGQPHCHSP